MIFVMTGGTERAVLQIVGLSRGPSDEARRDGVNDAGETRVRGGECVTLIAHPERNSLPAALEVLARLQQDGVPGRIVFLDGPDDAEGVDRLRDAVCSRRGLSSRETASAAGDAPGRVARSRTSLGVRTHAGSAGGHRPKPEGRPLDGRRIGLVGAPSDWLVASSPEPEVVREVWGASIVRIPLDEVVRRMDLDTGEASVFGESFGSGAAACREPSAADLEASGRVYAALRDIVDEHRLDAVTLRCFDLVTDLGATGCLGLSRLTDEGVIAGCEGDLVSALGLLWARETTGEVPWMANPARVDVETNTLTLAHCTVPVGLVRSYELRSHFESGRGAAIAGRLDDGLVTLLRIGGRRLEVIWLARGEIVASGDDEGLCRTQVDVRLADEGAVAQLLARPLGNHVVMVRGHHAI